MALLSKKRSSYYDKDSKTKIKVFRDACGKHVMHDGFIVPKVKKTVKDLHDTDQSAVQLMKDIYEAELADSLMQQSTVIAKARGEL